MIEGALRAHCGYGSAVRAAGGRLEGQDDGFVGLHHVIAEHGQLGCSAAASGIQRRMLTAQDPCYTYPVANLTLTIDEGTLRRARIRALEQGTSVNAVVRTFLDSYGGVEDERRALRRFVEIAEGSDSGVRGKGRGWTREDLYEERLRWPRS